MRHLSALKGVVYDFLDVTVPSQSELEIAFHKMSAQKQLRVSSFSKEIDRRRSICADWLGRTVAASFLSVSAEDITITQLENGQPSLGPLPCFISLSHSGTYAMCAVSGRPVGVDIEFPDDRGERVCRRICTEEELRYIFENGTYDRVRFAQIWTAKEAILKMDGKGLSGGISTLSVADSDGINTNRKECSLYSGEYNNHIFTIAESNHLE